MSPGVHRPSSKKIIGASLPVGVTALRLLSARGGVRERSSEGVADLSGVPGGDSVVVLGVIGFLNLLITGSTCSANFGLPAAKVFSTDRLSPRESTFEVSW